MRALAFSGVLLFAIIATAAVFIEKQRQKERSRCATRGGEVHYYVKLRMLCLSPDGRILR